MSQMKQAWHYVFVEPFTWLFYYFFQPTRFKEEVEVKSFLERAIKLLRLELPMFLCYFLVAYIVRIMIYTNMPNFYLPCSPNGPGLTNSCFLSSALLGTIWGGVLTASAGIIFGITFGITLTLAGGIVGGIISSASSGTLVGIVFALAYGITFGLLLGLSASGREDRKSNFLVISTLGITVGLVLGSLGGLIFGLLGGLLVGDVGASAISDKAGGFAGGALACYTVALIGTLIRSLSRRAGANTREALEIGRTIGITFAIIVGVSSGNIGSLSISQGLVTKGIEASITYGVEISIVAGIAFTVAYILGYYRLPLYPVSVLSMLKAYYASCTNAQQVFRYLHHSALYWDECVILPLPGLKHILLLATKQNFQQALEEIDFIVHERPQQRETAQAILHEIIIGDLEDRESLRTIAGASSRLMELLPQELRLLDAEWAKPFVRLEDASRDAMRYYSPLGWQARYDALKNLLMNLDRVHPRVAFSDAGLNKRLSNIVHTWRVVTKHELENLGKESQGLGRIDNPYHPGSALQLRDSLFVGRNDLVQQLEEALQKSPRPTFFLNGERRMGKSSILKQLPVLLGSSYLPIFYDVQSVGMTSSAAAFLAMLAEEVYEEMTVKGMQVKKLEYEHLQEGGKENEALVYHRFERWLKHIELILGLEGRTLLLALDEFEQLENARKKGYLDLNLLLNWLRNTIQNHPRLALLFSGVKSIGDIGPQWAGYFVNVEMLRVSFLQPEEAHQLIIRPTPDISQEHVFNEVVVKEIMRVTGCHPFLIQAVCSKLITLLNFERRAHAGIQDVEIAVRQVLEAWWDTYFCDLWERTDSHQRLCLAAIHELGQGNLRDLQQQSALEEPVLRHTLQALIKRDLIRQENGFYVLAAPIFSKWLERSASF